jgi:hypothetical protein
MSHKVHDAPLSAMSIVCTVRRKLRLPKLIGEGSVMLSNRMVATVRLSARNKEVLEVSGAC